MQRIPKRSAQAHTLIGIRDLSPEKVGPINTASNHFHSSGNLSVICTLDLCMRTRNYLVPFTPTNFIFNSSQNQLSDEKRCILTLGASLPHLDLLALL